MARTWLQGAVRGRGGARELEVVREFEAPLEVVWAAWTRPEQLSRWLTDPAGWRVTVCEIDLREGGRWCLAWQARDGAELRIQGVYQSVQPPERLVSTSSWGDPWPDTEELLVLEAVDGGTRVRQLTRYVSEEALDAALGRGVREGMVEAFDRLGTYLAGTRTEEAVLP